MNQRHEATDVTREPVATPPQTASRADTSSTDQRTLGRSSPSAVAVASSCAVGQPGGLRPATPAALASPGIALGLLNHLATEFMAAARHRPPPAIPAVGAMIRSTGSAVSAVLVRWSRSPLFAIALICRPAGVAAS